MSENQTLVAVYEKLRREEQEVARRAASTGEPTKYSATDAARIARFHRFELLDSVFEQFLATNKHRGHHYSLNELLQWTDRLKTPFQYTYDDIPYLATVFLHRGAERDWLNIKLNNDRFKYIS
jgi:hypothetical protein